MNISFLRNQTFRTLILLLCVAVANNCSAQNLNLGVEFPFYVSSDTIKSKHLASIKINNSVKSDFQKTISVNEYFFDDSGKLKLNLYTDNKNITDTAHFTFENGCNMDTKLKHELGILKLECNDRGQLLISEYANQKTYNKYDERYNLIETVSMSGFPERARMHDKITFNYDALNNPVEEIQYMNGRIIYNHKTLSEDTIYEYKNVEDFNYKDGFLKSVEEYIVTDTSKIEFKIINYFYKESSVVRVEIRQADTNELMAIATFEYMKKKE